MLAPAFRDVGNAVVDKVGDASGAYGLYGRRGGMIAYANPALKSTLPLQDFSHPDRDLLTGATHVSRSGRRMAKGSQEALAWGQQMRARRAAKSGGSFRPA
jgi:hypothetical protein